MGFDTSGIVQPEVVSGEKAIAALFRWKRVAIDAAGWMFEARAGARIAGHGAATGCDFGAWVGAWKSSATSLFEQRLGILKALEAMPIVVLETNQSAGKRGRERKDHAGGRGNWTAMVKAVERVCGELDVSVVVAPGEGEDECAALDARGVADLVWSADAVDCLLAGAQCIVHTPRGRGMRSKKGRPDLRNTEVVVVRSRGVAHGWVGLVVYAAMVGTDFVDGVKGVGAARARKRVDALWEAYRQSDRAERRQTTDFLAFCAAEVPDLKVGVEAYLERYRRD